jgi:hypothetical protein
LFGSKSSQSYPLSGSPNDAKTAKSDSAIIQVNIRNVTPRFGTYNLCLQILHTGQGVKLVNTVSVYYSESENQ